MSGTVSITIFAGLPNPSWRLSDDDSVRFQQLIPSYPVEVPTARFEPDGPDVLQRPLAGFRGFTITFQNDDRGGTRYHTYNRLILEEATGVLRRDLGERALEQELYATAPPAVVTRLGGMSYAQLITAGPVSLIAGLQGPDHDLQCGSSTLYPGNTGQWKTHRLDNNCYNYATDVLNTNPLALPAVPGPGAALLLNPLTEAALKDALVADDLASTGKQLPSVCPPAGSHYLVVLLRHDPNNLITDFHCVRLDRDGHWSHKDGAGPVRNVDDAHQPIVDLTQAKFRWSPSLVGIYIAYYDKRGLID
jgi:hypothetical protein